MKVAVSIGAAILIASLCWAVSTSLRSEEGDNRDATSENVPPPPVLAVPLARAKEAQKLEGIGTVLNPDGLLQLDADIRSATVAENFSRGQLERFKMSTMLSRQTIENAVRQEGINSSILRLAVTRLQQTWGDKAPFLSAESRQALMANIANGSRAILRLDFSDTADGMLHNVRVMPLRGGPETNVDEIWAAPSGNLAMPGVSFFGLINAGPGLRAGDRARVIADNPDGPVGVIIPGAAIVVYAGKSWCYVKMGPEKYERREVSLDAPVEEGFLVKSGFEAGTRVVIKGASILLAREATPGSLDDDDDGGGEAQVPVDAVKKPGAPSPVAQNHTAPRADPD
ncbi:MAG: hypothetical protein QM780_12010 [Hyphomicrobium sp.]|uniref:hypothetical protein n=1 Tax=Hyphomicrobium sp. TaxID=82 RepID=UPI0039E54D75